MLLSNWWDNQSTSQKVPTCGVYYFVIFVDQMADAPLEAANVLAVGLFWLAVIISYWRTFCWFTYSYFYLKLDEKEQSDKPPQQSSTKKTGKEKCFIEITKRFKG